MKEENRGCARARNHTSDLVVVDNAVCKLDLLRANRSSNRRISSIIITAGSMQWCFAQNMGNHTISVLKTLTRSEFCNLNFLKND